MLIVEHIKSPGHWYRIAYNDHGALLDWGGKVGSATYSAHLTNAEFRPEEEWRDHITQNLTARHWSACGLSCPVLTWGGTCRKDKYEECDGSFGKFSSAAAEVLYEWSLDGQPESCGDAQYGNGWHAFFPEDRAILHAANSGAVSAWPVPDNEWDAHRAEIEAGAVTEDDWQEEEEDGHPDDCRYCAAGESSVHTYEPPPTPCTEGQPCSDDLMCPEHCDCGECDDAAECGCTRGQMCMGHAIEHNTGPTGIVFFPAPVTG